MSIVQYAERRWKREGERGSGSFLLPRLTQNWLSLRQHDEADAVTYSLRTPGYRRRDLSIEVRDRVVIVRGEHTDGLFKQRSKKSFVHSFNLPETLDEHDVRAAFGGGVLRLTIRKKPHARRRQIAISKPAPSSRSGQVPTKDGDNTTPWRRLLSWLRNLP